MENVIFSRFDWTTCVFMAVNVELNIIHYQTFLHGIEVDIHLTGMHISSKNQVFH